MGISFAMIGERRDDPATYVVRGDDGHFYAYELKSGRITLVKPHGQWQVGSVPSVDGPLGSGPVPDTFEANDQMPINGL